MALTGGNEGYAGLLGCGHGTVQRVGSLGPVAWLRQLLACAVGLNVLLQGVKIVTSYL